MKIFGFFGKILDFSSNLRSSPWNIGNCLASGLSEGLHLRGQVLIIQRNGEWESFQEKGKFCGELDDIVKEQVSQKEKKKMMSKVLETKKPSKKSLSLQEPFLSYLSLIISLPWLILKSYFAKGKF